MSPPTPKRILLADPDATFRTALARTLKFKGYIVDQAASARQMFSVLSKVSPALVLLDISMPNTDGIQLIRHLRRDFPATDVVILSAGANVETTVEAVKLGVKDYLLKPMATVDVLIAIDIVLHLDTSLAPWHATVQSRTAIN